MQSTDPGGQTAGSSPADPMKSRTTWSTTKSWMIRWRGSRQLVLVIVAIALLLDNMLLTVVGKSQLKVETDYRNGENFIGRNTHANELDSIVVVRLNDLHHKLEVGFIEIFLKRLLSTPKLQFIYVKVPLFPLLDLSLRQDSSSFSPPTPFWMRGTRGYKIL